jgi:predicted nuclease of predicted toxin-antitoxin system
VAAGTSGVEAAAFRELGLRDAEDRAIFPAARQAGAVLMTKDSDFVDLVTRLGPPPQIVWLTCGDTTSAALRKLLADVWPRAAAFLAAGEPLVEVSGRAV